MLGERAGKGPAGAREANFIHPQLTENSQEGRGALFSFDISKHVPPDQTSGLQSRLPHLPGSLCEHLCFMLFFQRWDLWKCSLCLPTVENWPRPEWEILLPRLHYLFGSKYKFQKNSQNPRVLETVAWMGKLTLVASICSSQEKWYVLTH